MIDYFSDYINFSDQIKSKYHDVSKKYPLVFFVFYKEIAKSESGMNDYHARAMQDLSSFSPFRFIYRYFVIFLFKIYFKKGYKSAYVSLARFPEIDVEVSAYLRRVGLVPIVPLTKELVFKTARETSERRININSIPLSGLISIYFLRRINSVGLLNALRVERLMERLESLISKEIMIMREILSLCNLRLIIVQSDSAPSARIVVEAARLEGVPYIVIAHGYIQDKKLRSIAPIAADRLIVWSKNQFHELAKVMRKDEASKLRYYGWPKTRLIKKSDGHNTPLVVLSTIYHGDNLTEKRLFVERAIAELCSLYPMLRVRLHPKDRRVELQGELFMLSNKKLITLAHGDIGLELGSSSFVIGMGSSVLVEAAMSGCPVFQFKELMCMDLEGVVPISIDGLGQLEERIKELRLGKLVDNELNSRFSVQALIDDVLYL